MYLCLYFIGFFKCIINYTHNIIYTSLKVEWTQKAIGIVLNVELFLFLHF